MIDFLVRFTTTLFRFAHIFFISTISKVESFQRCSYVEIGTDLWTSWKWPFIKYFQTAGEVFEQSRQVMGTFEQGEEVDDSAATLYEYFTFIWHSRDNVWLIFRLRLAPFPLAKKNSQKGGGRRHKPQSSVDWVMPESWSIWAPMCSSMR
jgi:hypothetical protein